MPQPLAVRAIERELAQVYADGWQAIVREQERILSDPLAFRRRSRLVELRQAIERELNRMDAATRAWIEHRYPLIYAFGAQGGAAAAGETISSWTLIHTQALERLVNDTFGDLLSATRYVRRDTKRFIRELTKELATRKLTTGQTAVQAGRDLTRFLDEKGLRGIRYKDGSMHGLDEYGQMVIRTKTGTAYNEGTINGATEAGIRYFEVIDGPDCGWTFHEDPNLATGMIVNGHEALAEPLSHPNCRRTFGGRPDVLTRKQGAVTQRSVTAEQIRAQRTADLAARARRQSRRISA